MFEQRYDPFALQLGTRWSVTERRRRLRAIREKPGLRQLVSRSLLDCWYLHVRELVD